MVKGVKTPIVGALPIWRMGFVGRIAEPNIRSVFKSEVSQYR